MWAEQATEPVAHHGEGAVWDERLERILWVDLLRGDVLSTAPGSGVVDRCHVASVAACVVPRTGSGHLVATERGYAIVDTDIERLPDVWDDDRVRMNDGACDPQGRFYCGSMAYDASPGRGVLYRLDPDRTVHRVLGPVTISNGLAWSPDGDVAFYVDSPTQRIDVLSFDPDAGTFSGRRPVVNIPADVGMPDGLTLDAEGGIWVALWSGAAVHRYSAAGSLECVIDIPVRQPTSCAFGGRALDELYITTSAHDLDDAERGAGALFVARPGVSGLTSHRFAG